MTITDEFSKEDTLLTICLSASFCDGDKCENERGHLSGLAADLGSQVLEGFSRNLMKNLGKRMLGKTAGKVAGGVTGSAFSFASTYAIGHLAERYHSGGRTLSAQDRKPLLTSLSEEGKLLHACYLPEIQTRSQSLNPATIMSLVQGKHRNYETI